MTFTIPGNPQAWERARYDGRSKRFFTASKSFSYKTLIAHCAKESGIRLLSGPVRVSINLYLKRPLKMPKASGLGVLRCWKRPDVDNFSKNYLDALNGIAWVDDGQVHSLEVVKWYHEKAGAPRAEVEINAL